MSLVCLTLVVPLAAHDTLVDVLMARDGAPVEFSLHTVDARGPLVRLSSQDEQVRGFARRVEARLVLPAADCDALMPALHRALAGVDGGCWRTPVTDFTAFAAQAPATGSAP